MFQLTKEQLKLQAEARALADGPIRARAAEVDRTEAYPWDNVEALTKAGFMGMTIPKAYGGRGLTYLDAVLVIEQMARTCGVTGRIVVEANMGAIGAIMAYGSEEQKQLARRLRARRRQAGHLHHRARGRECRDRDVDSRRPPR